jgi:hypothetical protein
MRTSKPISNIGYISPELFRQRANDLRQSGAVGPVVWVSHKPEGGDKKPHLHILLLDGWGTYETVGLEAKFGYEIFPDGSKASLTARWQRTKDVRDWILYAIHEPTYLARKATFGKTAYSWDDLKITSGDEEILESLKNEAIEALEAGEGLVYRIVRHWVKQGKDWPSLVVSGLLPIATYGNAKYLFDTLKGRSVGACAD